MKTVLFMAPLLVAGLVYGAGELLARVYGEEIRTPLYGGAVAGALLALSGVPFMVRIARMSPTAERSNHPGQLQWMAWWGMGLLLRLVLLGILTPVLLWLFPQSRMTAALGMMTVYLLGLLCEVVCLVRTLDSADEKARQAKNGSNGQ